MVAIRHTGRPLSDEDIARLEVRMGTRLPESYRQFLQKNNGGRPPIHGDGIKIDRLPGEETDVQVFFGIDRSIESSNIDWNLSMFENRISDQLLPIACDSFGNLFCLSLSKQDYGSVVYCDFEPNNQLGGAVYYRVARDFDSFLGEIKSFETN
jgi:hypothetical protein